MKRSKIALVVPWLSLLACTQSKSAAETSPGTETTAPGTEDGPVGSSMGPGETGADASGTGTATTMMATDSGGGGFKYDVGGMPDEGLCKNAEAGIYCADNRATECDGNGNLVAQQFCLPDICVEGEGCVECLAGQFHCSGPRVMSCNTSADPPRWVESEVCNPAAGEGCNQEFGTCEVLSPLGSSTPTGTYYMYANFAVGGVYTGGFDVDSYDDLVYVTDFGGTHVDVYKITLHDSDNDGELEPNQHPDNPDETGPIEERTIEQVETIPNIKVYDTGLIASEIYALEDRMFVGGQEITEYMFGEDSSVVTIAPPWSYGGQGIFSMIGYDDIGKVWYAANEAARRVLQYDAETDSWGIAFLFPDLAGSHMDGLEVVTDPNTGTPYVYVSDMTSDFIGQYRLDDELGWVQENLFEYAGQAGSSVEGMGFGALNHFWVSEYTTLYEIGGGDLVQYTEPKPTG